MVGVLISIYSLETSFSQEREKVDLLSSCLKSPRFGIRDITELFTCTFLISVNALRKVSKKSGWEEANNFFPPWVINRSRLH